MMGRISRFSTDREGFLCSISQPSIFNMPDTVLEIFGQPPLNIYTQICLCYSMDKARRSEIVHILQSGLVRLTESFPWIAGQVVRDDTSGLFKITTLGKTPRLVVKDVTDTALHMEQLKNVQFPFRMMHETDLAPRSTIPGLFSESEHNPVFLLQATYIDGGLLLTFLGHHQAIDGTGLAQIVSLLSKACNGEPFTEEEKIMGNMERDNIVPLFSEIERLRYGDLYEKLKHQIVPKYTPTTSENPPSCSWRYFIFSGDSLSKLKQLASQNLTTGIPFVSTDDSLTAFVWQAVSRARLQRLEKNTKTTIGRAINVRPCLGIRNTYPGMITNMAYSNNTLSELVDAPLGHVASNLRSKLDSEELKQNTRALATLINDNLGTPITSPTATMDMSSDIALSSWAQQNFYALDFGLGLGLPESVRRPEFTPVESLMYFLPKTKKGDVALAICLREEDMEALRKDGEMMKYATFIE